MKIRLEKIGKKFNTEWIFRDVTFGIDEGSVTAILGRNGSGKSTLLQVIAGNLHPNQGTLSYEHQGQVIHPDQVFRHLSIVAPYLELIEEFTLDEMTGFHFSFKNYLPGYSAEKIRDLLGFRVTPHKQIRQFSSGMKQRVKLALAILSDVPLLLLDEPTMNLDQAGIEWYHELLSRHREGRTTIICSNLYQTEAGFAGQSLEIEHYKK